ncbi:MAG: hypothetical protein IT165_33275 [Bryobacterales bacterium]|nr:hypothetical protein [Bryobacterales bacterium]
MRTKLSIPSILKDAGEVRRVFNEGGFERDAQLGLLTIEVADSRPATDSSIRNWAPGTLSQNIYYLNKNREILAKAHRYLRPDNTLAASGMPDPKRVWDGTNYLVVKV